VRRIQAEKPSSLRAPLLPPLPGPAAASAENASLVVSLRAEKEAARAGLKDLVNQLDSLTSFAHVVGRRISSSLSPQQQQEQRAPADAAGGTDAAGTRIKQLEEMIEVQKAMLSQAQKTLQAKTQEAVERSNEAAELRAALASTKLEHKHLEDEEDEDLSEAHNTTGVLFSVRSSPRRSPPGTPSKPEQLHPERSKVMLLASLSALLQQQSVEVLTEILARLSAEQDAAARGEAGINDPELLVSLPHPDRAQQPASSLTPPIRRPGRAEPTPDASFGVRERGSVGLSGAPCARGRESEGAGETLSLLRPHEGLERVGVGLSVLMPAASSEEVAPGGAAASSGGCRLPVVEAVLEGSPAFIDGRIRPGRH
jgi:hypothetical protein